MQRVGRIMLVGCLVLVASTFVVMADAKKAAVYAREAATHAARAYGYARKASYNSSGRVKRYTRLAMDAAKKAERAANNAFEALGPTEE